MTTRVIQPSFAAGEIAPALYARTDLDKYHAGAAILRNFFVDYRGGVSSRPGTQYIGTCKAVDDKPRLIPFVVATTIAYALEVGAGYIRFIANGGYVGGGTPTEVSTPYAAADLALLKYTQSADVMTFTHPSYPSYNLTQVSAGVFSFDAIVIGATIDAPSTLNVNAVNSTMGNFIYGYTVTAVSGTGEESVQALPYFAETDLLNQNTGVVNYITWNTVDGAQYYNVYKSGPVPSGEGNTSSPPSVAFGYIGQTDAALFVDNNIGQDLAKTPPLFQDPFSPGQISNVNLDSRGTGYTTVAHRTPLIFTGGGGTGAAGYAILDKTTGTVAGVIMTDFGKNYTSVPAVSDSDANTATYTATVGPQSGTYPACCSYFQQRRVFGGTDNLPEALIMSQTGSYNNFNVSPIVQASDAIQASIASRQANVIKGMVAMNTGLVVLTTGSAFLISGGGTNESISPANLIALPQASSGCNDLPPLVINYDILYCQNRGAVVRDLAFNFYVQSYTGTDRSVLASHLFSGFTLTDWTYAEEPFRLVYVVRNDGLLLTLTYVPEQEIYAWAHHDTDGFFISVCAIPEGLVNAVYVIVQRYIGGSWLYYVERFANRVITAVQNAWCLDAALSAPQTNPAAGLTLSGAVGTIGASITLTASAGVFSSGDVGKTLWAGDGQALVSAFTSSTILSAQVVKPFAVVTDNVSSLPIPYAQNDWALDAPLTTLSGLAHLNGQSVMALVDGVPQGPFTVSGGAVTLTSAGTKIVVGLSFTAQFQTLRLDTGSPTIQGARKLTPAVTARVLNTLGLTIGQDFIHMNDLKYFGAPYTPGSFLYSDDIRCVIPAYWDKKGLICAQLTQPLPATILGVIPEVTLGDTMR